MIFSTSGGGGGVLLLDEDLHDGPADLHSHTVLLEHVEERQETLLRNKKQMN